ncbi:MAG: Na+/H+ antiporter NhaC family protein [Thermoanaerobaculia bacterium]
MRKLLLLCWLAVAPQTAFADPPFEVSVPVTLAGTPLRIDVTGVGQPDLVATVRVDGREIGKQPLEEGDHRLSFDDAAIGSGTHELEVITSAGSVVTGFRVLPGWLSILPPLLAIGLALLTKDVLIALFLGIFGGAMILFSWNPAAAFGHVLDKFVVEALSDPSRASIVIFTTLLGGMVGLITKSGGTHGIVEALTPYATSRRRGQLATWAMGLLVFFDDYANTLIVGPTMRPITDRLRISREKLAYIVDSTAAPVVCLFPISTWVGFEIGLIGGAFDQLGLPYDAYSTFVATIPYRFYPIFALLIVVTLVMSRVDFGPMRLAENRARVEGKVLADDAEPIADYASADVEPPPDIPKRALNALVPIATVVVVTLIGLYVSGVSGVTRGVDQSFIDWIRNVLANADSYKTLLWASLSGATVALVLPVSQGLLKLREAMAAMVAGFKAMLMALVVLILAWSLSGVCAELQTAAYMVGLTDDVLSPGWLPALTFFLSAAIAFATGSSWGTMAIIEPLVIPICHSLAIAAGLEVGSAAYGSLMFATIGSVLAGSIWGDHCSPISDTTILSSMASGCDHIAHVRTQLPYAFAGGALAVLVGNVPVAFGWSPWISLLVGAVVIVGGVTVLKRWQGLRPSEILQHRDADRR